MVEWEYKQIVGRNLEADLNELGRQGWDVIFAQVVDTSTAAERSWSIVALLKRPWKRPTETDEYGGLFNRGG